MVNYQWLIVTTVTHEETPLARFESANLIALNRQLSAPSLRRPRLANATGSNGSSHPYDPIALARSLVRLLDESPGGRLFDMAFALCLTLHIMDHP